MKSLYDTTPEELLAEYSWAEVAINEPEDPDGISNDEIIKIFARVEQRILRLMHKGLTTEKRV
jgi:hypothetical protein